MTTLKRIEKLMALLAIGFSWAHKVGEWRANTQKPILFKKHRESFRPQNNFFRYAFHFIRDNLINFFKKISQFKLCLQPFSRSVLSISFFNFCPVLNKYGLYPRLLIFS
jgi:hypothetical protein